MLTLLSNYRAKQHDESILTVGSKKEGRSVNFSLLEHWQKHVDDKCMNHIHMTATLKNSQVLLLNANSCQNFRNIALRWFYYL